MPNKLLRPTSSLCTFYAVATLLFLRKCGMKQATAEQSVMCISGFE